MQIKLENNNYEDTLNLQRKYPTVVIDDFFQNPDIIRKYALSLPYEKAVDGRWPGKRSPLLHTINEKLVYSIAKKMLSVYYDLSTEIYWHSIQMAFQKIKPYSKDKNSNLNKGWIHTDGVRTLAGVVYLTPSVEIDAGTSIFKIKSIHADYDIKKQQTVKDKLYKDNSCDMNEYNKEINNLYDKFNKVTEVKNIYNRCILYDAHEYHTGTNYFTNDKERLSLVFFFTNLTSSIPPKDRIMYFDKEIEYDIMNCKKNGKDSNNHT